MISGRFRQKPSKNIIIFQQKLFVENMRFCDFVENFDFQLQKWRYSEKNCYEFEDDVHFIIQTDLHVDESGGDFLMRLPLRC